MFLYCEEVQAGIAEMPLGLYQEVKKKIGNNVGICWTLDRGGACSN